MNIKCCTIFIRLLKRRIFYSNMYFYAFFGTNEDLFMGNDRFSIIYDLNNELKVDKGQRGSMGPHSHQTRTESMCFPCLVK